MVARLERSHGHFTKQSSDAWLEREEERHRMTLEGLDDVDAGRVIDQEAVRAWADSLSTDTPLALPLE